MWQKECLWEKKEEVSVLNPMNFILYKADPGSLGLLAAEIKAGFYYRYVKRWRRVCKNVSWIYNTIKTQEKEKPLYAKRSLKLEKNEIFIITILKAQGNFPYTPEQAPSKVLSKQRIRRWQRDWKE